MRISYGKKKTSKTQQPAVARYSQTAALVPKMGVGHRGDNRLGMIRSNSIYAAEAAERMRLAFKKYETLCDNSDGVRALDSDILASFLSCPAAPGRIRCYTRCH